MPKHRELDYGTLEASHAEERKKTKFAIRHLMVLLIFFAFVNIYLMRVNFSIAIVGMVAQRNVSTGSGTWTLEQDFSWNSRAQGLLLSSFFWGYTFMQFPGGLIANRYGGKNILGIGILLTSLLTALTPIAATFGGFWSILILRVLEGLAEAMTFPAQSDFWSKWAPKFERTKLVCISGSGVFAGTLIAMPLCGLLAQHFGWQSIFYVFGASGICWSIFWFMFASDTPEDNRFISHDEKEYIVSARDLTIEIVSFKRVPWKRVFTSGSTLVLFFAHFCEDWGFYTLLTELPTFIKDIFQFDIAQSGFISGLPYVVLTLMNFASSFLADFLRKKGILSTTGVRKSFVFFGFSFQAIFLLSVGFASWPSVAITLLAFAVGFGGLATPNLAVNVLDLGSKYSGILMGINNTVGSMAGIISPVFTGFLTPNKSLDEWRIVFSVGSCFYIFGAVFYAIFGSGETQI